MQIRTHLISLFFWFLNLVMRIFMPQTSHYNFLSFFSFNNFFIVCVVRKINLKSIRHHLIVFLGIAASAQKTPHSNAARRQKKSSTCGGKKRAAVLRIDVPRVVTSVQLCARQKRRSQLRGNILIRS